MVGKYDLSDIQDAFPQFKSDQKDLVKVLKWNP